MHNTATIMFEYERAAINAFAQVFLMRRLKAVSFTLAKLYGEVFKPTDCKKRYQNDEEFAVVIKQFHALALVTTVDVIPCYDEFYPH